MRIVVIGGTGNFGARICRALADDPSLEIVACSRHAADRLSYPVDSTAIRSAQLDIETEDFAQQLRALAPHIVIHCAGPFQGQNYRVAEATIDAGSHYIDIADGRDFVCNFGSSLNARATNAGFLAVSGASSVPALSSAVVDHLARDLRSLHSIDICIAPAQQAPRGAATIAGVFSYAGRPFEWLVDSRWQTAYGWQELATIEFRSLGSRRAAACDVPDLELFPDRYRGVHTVRFRAALELAIEHHALWISAALRRIGIPLPIEHWASPLDKLATRLNRLGSQRGGMLVSVSGEDRNGARVRFNWELTADDNHGPEIPCMPAILLARKIASGAISTRGARPCMGLLTLDEFATEFARWGITSTISTIAI
ncbi:MAG: saccharopine dehydrogenase NADP-binding domain-containing protein [Gammaproteobacteria bacterium]